MRTTPLQARSRERLETILDAAAVLFADVGFGSTTMEAVAERAQTSIGSLYRFFPDKRRLFGAVVERNQERSRALHEQLLNAEALKLPWAQLLDLLIDSFEALRRTDPGFRAVALNLHLIDVYADTENRLYEDLIARTELVLKQVFPALPRAKTHIVASMINYVIIAMLFVSDRKTPVEVEELMTETKLLLRGYLEPYASGDAKPND